MVTYIFFKCQGDRSFCKFGICSVDILVASSGDGRNLAEHSVVDVVILVA